MKKEIKTLENMTTVLKLIIWSFSLTTLNGKSTIATDDGLSVPTAIWFCCFFLCKKFLNVVKDKLISIDNKQNPLNLKEEKKVKNQVKTETSSSHEYILYNIILRIARNLLETKENVKIESHPFYHIICDFSR